MGFEHGLPALASRNVTYGAGTANFRLSGNNDVLSLFAPRLEDLLQLPLSAKRVATSRRVGSLYPTRRLRLWDPTLIQFETHYCEGIFTFTNYCNGF